ncbi:MAG: hypothetical protein PVJ76_12965 [Gemmatimonadota bacterium]
MNDIDLRSFQLGMINCFAEMVAVGVKKLAISPPLSQEEYGALREASDAIVEGSGIHSYLETSLLVTDLQSAEFTEGKWSILYFNDPETLAAYKALKERKAELEGAGRYDGQARHQISAEFMRLLSYPEGVIKAKIEGGGEEDPFILVTDD